MVVLVTGSSGQLGQSLQFIAPNYSDPSQKSEQTKQIDFVFCSSQELDITNLVNCEQIFSKHKPQYCINTAAYTAVDNAESETEKAYLINVVGAKNLTAVCKKHDTILLHISTDFVYDGDSAKPYTENDIPNPKGVYGQTKLNGEKAIQNMWRKHYIIRTSWVYSQFGNNFMKTMLRLASERDTISVVNDQIGTPTNAVDLADVLVQIILTNNRQPTIDNYGIYNFSNEGQCSWYDFAQKIFEVNNITLNLQPIPTSSFPTAAMRPKFSVLDKSKIIAKFGIHIQKWEESLVKINM